MTLFILLAVALLFIGGVAWATSQVDKDSTFSHPSLQQLVPIYFEHLPQVTVDVTAGPVVKIPFKCRVIKCQGIVTTAGGGTVHTDVDMVFKNVTGSVTIGTAPAVDGSVIASGGALASPASGAVAEIAANDVVEMEIDIAGGSTPTADGCRGILWVERY
jgi:hypothetical protein